MGDCSNATMRDRLPDLLHDRLPIAERAEVRAHVAACAACRSELELLARMRAVPNTPRVDASRIVAIVAIVAALPPYRRASPWRRAAQSPMLRAAAAVVLLAGGVAIGISVGDRREPLLVRALADDSSLVVVTARPVVTGRGATTTPAQPATTSGSTELAMGEMLDDLSDSDLRALLDVVGKLEAMTPSETEIVVPAIVRGGA